VDLRKDFFEMHAVRWDTMLPPGLKERVERDLMPLFGIAVGDRVLDVGCGTGILLPALRNAAGPAGSVTALDYARNMIEAAKVKNGPGFTYVCAAAEQTGLPDASFDTIICFSVFPHFPDKGAALRELRRLLAAGGKLVVAHADTRERINTFHATMSGPVNQDHLPANDVMLQLLEKADFADTCIQEGRDYYLACGSVPA
jgi:ubiquinone/menaquinone biosynthesis C-methylase UbiE